MPAQEKCPMCGTKGKEWKQKESIYQCPNCESVYSEFGLVMESQKEVHDFWS